MRDAVESIEERREMEFSSKSSSKEFSGNDRGEGRNEI